MSDELACKGKKHYSTIDEAIQAAGRAREHGALRSSPYRCPDCLIAFRIGPARIAIRRNAEARRRKRLGKSRSRRT